MYKPDPRIVRKLKEYDRDLDARWDVEQSRWFVTWRGKDVITCQNEDGSYRPLDERAVTKCRVNDGWAHKSGAAFCRMLEEEKNRLDRADRAKLMDDFQQMAKSDLHRSMFGGTQITGWSAGA